MLSLKDIPIALVPYAFFLVAVATFGELYIRVPSVSNLEYTLKMCLGFFMIPSGILFFTKLMFEWPKMKGLKVG